MPVLKINFEPDGAGRDLVDKEVIHLGNDAPPIEVLVLDHGMQSGKPSVMLRIDLPDGFKVVIAETSARLFCTAARAIMGKYPDLFEGD